MDTARLQVDPVFPDEDRIKQAAAVLRAGGLVAFPTETVYGLGGNALDPDAARRIYAAKGRPSDNPLIIHVADTAEVRLLTSFLPGKAWQLMGRFWPGPLTLVLPRSQAVPLETTGGLDTVAVRMPRHQVALALIRAAGTPLAAPSANSSGRPSPTVAAHVLADLGGRIEMVLDAGPTAIGLESTVLDLTVDPAAILRPGGLSREALASVLGEVALAHQSLPDTAGREDYGETASLSFQPGQEIPDSLHVSGLDDCSPDSTAPPAPRSPGLKYRHYAPRAPVYLLVGRRERVAKSMLKTARRECSVGRRVALILSAETAGDLQDYGLQEPGVEVFNLAASNYGHADGLPVPGLAGTLVQGEPGDRRGKVLLLVLGSLDRLEEVAANLFSALRCCDSWDAGLILAETYPEQDLGLAVMDRLRRAAANRTIKIE